MQSTTTAPADVENATSNADVAAALDRLTARLERMERSFSGVTGMTEQAPALIATVADTVDAAVRDAGARGVDIDERVASLLHLGERLTHKDTVQALDALLDHTGEVGKLLALADEAPGLLAAAVDTADGYMQKARAAGLDVELLLTNGSTLLGGLGDATNHALTASQKDGARPSTFGLLRLLGDPDVRRSLGFFLVLAKHFGRTLAATRR